MRNYKENPLNKGEHIPYEELYDYYIVQNKSREECANYFNTTRGKIHQEIKYHKIKKDREACQSCKERRMFDLYGVTNIKKLPETQEKFKQTCLEKYGVEHVMKVPEVKDKIQKLFNKKYGGNAPMCSDEIKEKVKNTNLERYGVKTPAECPEILEKIQKTNLERYGDVCSARNEDVKKKMEQTNLKRYGVKAPSQNKEIFDRVKQHNLEKYGVEYYFNTPDFREKFIKASLERFGYDHPNKNPYQQKKIFDTMKANDSYKKSWPEEYINEKFEKKFDTFERQYDKDPRYPFLCDFYIPELDLFIEYQGYKGHHDYPYTGSEEDLKIVEEWREKAKELKIDGTPKDQYLDFIDTWTRSDPIKRETAKRDNLNYLEFFSLKDFDEWFDSLD